MVAIGLKLYTLTARSAGAEALPRPPRPAGRLIWLHVPEGLPGRGMVELARRIRDEDGHPVLMTAAEGASLPDGVIHQPAPPDSPAALRAFLDHWRPDALVMCGGEIRPALIHEAGLRTLPLMLVEAEAPHLPPGREGWYPGLMRRALAALGEVSAVNETAARALRKAGATVRVSGRMEEPSAALPYNEAEREALARQLATRPVWLAAHLPEAEEAAVIEAHRACLRLAHRLLLIVVPQDPARATALAETVERDEGWITARRVLEEEPEADVELFIADAAEMGLWYRLAPITFLGGSLAGHGCIADPMEAAALGSSLIHGPRPGGHGATFGRLGAARATRSVASAADLAEAVAELLSPDRAARLAQAAWGVASDGVEATERALAAIRRMLGEE